jgi:hypothetical protein
MSYWVSQSAGPTVDRVNEIVAAYKAGQLDARAAWLELAEIYCSLNGQYPNRVEPLKHFEYHQAQGDVDYMLTDWFPRFANIWYVGWPNECEAIAWQLERENPGTKFQVRHDY